MEIINFELGEKLYQYFDVEFDEESEFMILNPKNKITRNLKTTCLFWLEARFAFCVWYSYIVILMI